MLIPHEGHEDFGCIAYEGVGISLGLRNGVDMGDHQRVIFTLLLEQPNLWKGEIRDSQLRHLKKTTFAIDLVQPPSVASRNEIITRMRQTLYSIVLFGMPRLTTGLEILGKRYPNGIFVERVMSPLPIFLNPCTDPALLSERTFENAKLAVKGIREIQTTKNDFCRLRRGFLWWAAAIQSNLPHRRLLRHLNAIEAIVKPNEGQISEQFVDRSALFTVNRSIVIELLKFRRAGESAPAHNPIPITKSPVKPWHISLQAELLAQAVYTRILCNPVLLEQFRTDATIDAFWRRGQGFRRMIWGKAVNLKHLARKRIVTGSS